MATELEAIIEHYQNKAVLKFQERWSGEPLEAIEDNIIELFKVLGIDPDAPEGTCKYRYVYCPVFASLSDGKILDRIDIQKLREKEPQYGKEKEGRSPKER